MLVLEGRAFLRGRIESVALGIEDGRIVRVAKTLAGDERRDYGQRLLLPGGVDLHVHFREPGATQAEDFHTGTMAAAIGGVTAVFDMPNTEPPVTSRSAYEDKLRLVRRKANVDFGLYGALQRARDAQTWKSLGAPGKMYMAHSAGDLQVTDETVQSEIVGAVGDSQILAVVHAEDAKRIAANPGTSLAGHNESRPGEAEAVAIGALGSTAKSSQRLTRLHIAHVSSRAALVALKGTGFTAEATPHHLFLDAAMPLKAYGKVNPPLRTPDDREALWSAVVDGRIDAVASDHAPRTSEEKDLPFERAPPGVPGVETMVPLLLRKLKAGDLDVTRFVDLTARRPAEVLGVDLGVLDVGRPAHLIVVDPRDIVAIRGRDLHSKCGWTPFERFEAVFPQAVYLRGQLIAEGRTLIAEGRGQLVRLATPASGVAT